MRSPRSVAEMFIEELSEECAAAPWSATFAKMVALLTERDYSIESTVL